jgi:hypothetical protein
VLQIYFIYYYKCNKIAFIFVITIQNQLELAQKIYLNNMKHFIKSEKLDQLGMTASLACAVHCAVLPFVLTALPLFGLSFLAHSWVEMSMIGLSLLIGVYSLSTSYPKHKRLLPIIILVVGFAMIGTGHYLIENLEAVLIPIGGFTIAFAHYINWKYSRSCAHK